MPSGLLVALLVASCAMPLSSCSRDPADRAAKKRIFSPEDPPRVVASAQERLEVRSLGADDALTRRVLRMDAAETTERLGPHRYQAAVRFEWTARGGQLELRESRSLLSGAGLGGDFHAVVTNNHDQGLDVIRAHGQVYARGRYGKYRLRARDRGMAERGRDEVFGALRDFDVLFGGRLKLQPDGEVSSEGRPARRFRVTLGPAPEAVAGPVDLPPLLEPKGGADQPTLARRRFQEKREPQEISGEIWVDEETAAVLRARLEGQLKVPAEGELAREASVRLSLDSSISGIGVDPGIRTPKDFLPDEDKPHGIADALERFGVRPGAVDAGTPATTAPEATDTRAPQEPEDEAP